MRNNKIQKDKDSAIKAATKFIRDKYLNALVSFVGGSFNRNEETDTSDIDLVVVFSYVDHAWRESVTFDGWPIELFCHDEETLKYFFYEVDRLDGIPSLAQMVLEGPIITEDTDSANRIKLMAEEFIKEGPPKLSEDESKNHRYTISDLLDDLKSPRNSFEGMIIAGKLHGLLAYYFFRYNGHWAAGTKHIPRQMKKLYPEMAKQWESAFTQAFSGQFSPVIDLTEEILFKTGGYLFNGYTRSAPKDWRK